jgi:hypothetical protein
MDQKRNRPLAATGASKKYFTECGTCRPPVAHAQAIYILRLTSPHGDDIRRLWWLPKRLLRGLGLRCVSIEVEEASR